MPSARALTAPPAISAVRSRRLGHRAESACYALSVPRRFRPRSRTKVGMSKPLSLRVVVTFSGESLLGPARFGILHRSLACIAADLLVSRDLGVAIAVVVGGGNIFRGVNVS